MKVSVVICTHNRADSVHRTLESLILQTLPKEDFEIIVVDNASSDHTKNVVSGFSQHKNVRYIYEQTLGLSRARNTGWKNARGRYIAFLDDDATTHKAWLQKLLEGFEHASTGHVCVGGKVELTLPIERPVWLPDDLLFCLGVLNCGETPTILNNTQYFLHGCNMAMKKETLEHFRGFQENLGRVGKNLLSAGEILLQKQLIQSGGHCFYYPAMSVVHHVPRSRLTKQWFLKRMYWEGYSLARVTEIQKNMNKKTVRQNIIKEIRWLWNNTGRYDLLMRTNNSEDFLRACEKMRHLGSMAQFLRLH